MRNVIDEDLELINGKNLINNFHLLLSIFLKGARFKYGNKGGGKQKVHVGGSHVVIYSWLMVDIRKEFFPKQHIFLFFFLVKTSLQTR